MSIAENHFIQHENGTDSEANSDDGSDYYQPISAVDDNDSDQETPIENNGILHQEDSLPSPNPNCLNNGYAPAENGIANLHLKDDEIEEEEEEEEEARVIEDSESAISRAFREDENRRNAPLSQENAVRIMESMRRISFGGFTPDWANSVPEDRWIDQLRRLRQIQSSPPPPTATATTSSTTTSAAQS